MPLYKQVLIIILYLGIGALFHATQIADGFDETSTVSWGYLLGWPMVCLTIFIAWAVWFLLWAVVIVALVFLVVFLIGICRGLWELAKVKLELRRQQRQADEDYKFGHHDPKY